jgi:transcriptional regulator with XRE-family HTH domain
MLHKNTPGERIRAAREAIGMSQQELADLLGVTKAAVSSWENGRFRASAEHYDQLADALQVPLAFLALGAGKPPQKPSDDDRRKMSTLRLRVLIREGRLDALIMPRITALIRSGALDDLLEHHGYHRNE